MIPLALSGLVALLWAAPAGDFSRWWRTADAEPPYKSASGKPLPALRVQGNTIVDAEGKTVLLRGVSISDPDKVEHERHWNKDHFARIKAMGATVVRIPVHPIAWRRRQPVPYLALLDQAVHWCTELGLYVIVDWHSIGNLDTGLFQAPMYETTRSETLAFWRRIARHYRDVPTVAFYELFNEPTTYHGQLGAIAWTQWRKLVEEIIGVIRAHEAPGIPLVAGLDWAYDLAPLRNEPIQAEGIAYVTHPYPKKHAAPWPPKWDETFGFAAARYPVIATEIGFSTTPGDDFYAPGYAQAITTYLESQGISWVAWCFDPEWTPALLQSWSYALTGAGAYFRQAMQAKPTAPAAKGSAK